MIQHLTVAHAKGAIPTLSSFDLDSLAPFASSALLPWVTSLLNREMLTDPARDFETDIPNETIRNLVAGGLAQLAMRAAIPRLDLALGAAGFHVTNTTGLAPASSQRVNAFADELLRGARFDIQLAYEIYWDAKPTERANIATPGLFNTHGPRHSLHSRPTVYTTLMPDSAPSWVEALPHLEAAEQILCTRLLGEDHYEELCHLVETGGKLPPWAHDLATAIACHALDLQGCGSIATRREEKRRIDRAVTKLREGGDAWPLYQKHLASHKPDITYKGNQEPGNMFVA